MAEHRAVAISTVVEIHGTGRRALDARSRALRSWMRTIEGLPVLARREGTKLPEIDRVACAAIVLTAAHYVHDYARRGAVKRVQEKAPAVQALARAMFEHGVPAPA